MALPVAAILALSGLIGFGGLTTASQAEQARRLVGLGATAAELTAQLQRERAAAALVFAQESRPQALDAYQRQAESTDVVAARFRSGPDASDAPQGLAAPLQRVAGQLAVLPLLREQVRSSKDVAGSVVIFRYRAVIADLGTYRLALSQLGVDAETANGLRADATLSQAIEALGLMQVTVLPATGAGQLSAADQQQVVAADATFSESIESFRELAPPTWQASLAAQSGGKQVVAGERLQGVAARTAPDAPLDLGTSAAGWASAMDARMEQMHAVEHDIDVELLASVTRQRDAQQRTLVILAVVVLACLVVLSIIGWWITRSMTRPLRLLTAGATNMATTSLPALVGRLTTAAVDVHAIDREIAQVSRPLPVTSRDEVGAVAKAFNEVATTATRLAGEQAALRRTVNLISEAVARRLQRQHDLVMASLDQLEANEEDPDRLKLIFQVDQRATLVRRIIDNLQVLAGGRAGLPAREGLDLPTVVKAAIGRVENAYNRVQDVDVDTDVVIEASAAEELIHLLSELLDNAVRYSQPEHQVQVSARRVGDQLHLQVADHGIGIPVDQLPQLQRRVDAFAMDDKTARHMGLPVVGRIAARLGLRVQLRCDAEAEPGTRVNVVIPPRLFGLKKTPVRTAHQARTGPAAVIPAQRAPELERAMTALVAPPATMELPVAGRRADAAPPSWPLPAVPAPPLHIFDEVAAQHHPWFAAPQSGSDQTQVLPVLTPGWQQAAAAAEAAQQQAAQRSLQAAAGTAEPQRQTRHGLPVRSPGEFTVPTVTVTVTAPAAGRRNGRAVAHQLAAFGASVSATRRPPAPPRQIGPS